MTYKLTYSPYREEKEQLRTGYKHMIRNMETKYHLTLSYKYGMNELVCNELLNLLLKFLNRAILKKRYNQCGNFIEGMVVREETFGKENIHYHILITDREQKMPDKERIEEIIHNKIDLANKRYGYKNRISDFLLQEYYRGELEDYLTKMFKRTSLSLEDKTNSFCPLDHSGANFTLLRA